MKIKKRILFFFISDIILIILSVFFAFLLRFDGVLPDKYLEEGIFQNMLALSILFSLPLFYLFNLYSFSWSFVGITELKSLFKATMLSFLFTSFSIFTFSAFEGFPRSILLISYILIFIFLGGIRFSKRIYTEAFSKKNGKIRTLIIGAGSAGEELLRSIINGSSDYYPVGFLDDNPLKKGILIHGVRVLGKIEEIEKVIEKEKIEEILIALPSADSFVIRDSVDLARRAGIKKIKIIPPVEEIMKGKISHSSLRDIRVEDLLKRGAFSFEKEKASNLIKDKRVLVTGGAGSIGSELVKQITKLNPSLIIILDQDETGIFHIQKELSSFDGKKEFIVGDIRDKEKIERIFSHLKPEIVFHAAAYKHVGLMELNPDEAFINNVIGTKILAEISSEKKVEKFIFISTDKAVNPTSVMGMTKRIGEIICRALNGETKFISVRFGNVLGSRGSVFPLFKEQIKKGGPVEITHPDMKRYFMMISEAVSLVLQAGEMGEGGEVFVLDMGKPIKIVDLAKEMIRLSGLEPDREIPIVFTSPNKGEKLFEEILTSEEGTIATKNEKIFKAVQREINKENLYSFIERPRSDIKEELFKFIKESL